MALKCLVIISDGCEEIETVAPIDILRRAGILVTVAGLTSDKPITCSRLINIIPDCSLQSIHSSEFDILVLPGWPLD